jgi:hypothetical protein
MSVEYFIIRGKIIIELRLISNKSFGKTKKSFTKKKLRRRNRSNITIEKPFKFALRDVL